MRDYPCPFEYCSTVGTYRNNLRTHLMGNTPGHNLSREEADAVIDALEGRGPMPVLDFNELPGTRASHTGAERYASTARTTTPRSSDDGKQPVRDGHRAALASLEDTASARRTLDLYRVAVEAPVYLRVTEKGLVVISLDHERCSAMIGVSGRDTGDEVLTSLPPSPSHISRAVAGYLAKRDSLRRDSPEEQFALSLVRGALEGGLHLAPTRLAFVHQEWRMPTEAGGGKLDLLAVDLRSRQLVVVELKKSREAAAERDSKGRNAREQAESYATILHYYRTASYPFFQSLAQANAKLWGGPAEMTTLTLDPEKKPRAVVWFPGGPRLER